MPCRKQIQLHWTWYCQRMLGVSQSYPKWLFPIHISKYTKSTKWLRQKWHGHLGSEMSIASTVWLPSGSIWPRNSTIWHLFHGKIMMFESSTSNYRKVIGISIMWIPMVKCPDTLESHAYIKPIIFSYIGSRATGDCRIGTKSHILWLKSLERREAFKILLF